MIFTDPFFLFIFLPISCLVFHAVGRRFGSMGGLYVLLITSILFYLPWGAWMTALLVVSVVINFFVGNLLLLDGISRRNRIALLAAGELYNFTALIWFKYHFLHAWTGDGGMAGWVIPAGISFYTFHQAAFLADAFAREPTVVSFLGGVKTLAGRCNAFVRYAAFVTFFPQLVIGPITYMREFEPQVSRRLFGRVTYINVAVGFTFIVIGLFKKTVIADHFDSRAATLFSDAAAGVATHPMEAWLGILAYYLQLYFDFSGYSDIALGLARIFGIRYPANFFSPFKAVGIIDYYRRWHMTLTRVISRFLFSPLSIIGSRFAARRRYPAIIARIIGVWIPLAINFEVIGLWHAATGPLIVFGLIHGAWYITETEVRRSRSWKRWRGDSPAWLRVLLGRVLLFSLMPLTFAIFRSESLPAAWFLLSHLASASSTMSGNGSGGAIALAFLVVYLLPNSIEFLRSYRPAIMVYANESYGFRWLKFRWRPTWFWMFVIAAMGVIWLYYMHRHAPFLYQGF